MPRRRGHFHPRAHRRHDACAVEAEDHRRLQKVALPVGEHHGAPRGKSVIPEGRIVGNAVSGRAIGPAEMPDARGNVDVALVAVLHGRGGEWERHFASRAVDDQRFPPRRAIGTHLHMEVVVPGEAHFGPAREVRLVEQRGRIGDSLLVQLQALVASFMREQHSSGRDGKSVPSVCRSIDASNSMLESALIS